MSTIAGILIDLALAALVGLYASRKGFSFWAYFFLSAVATPIVALITIHVARQRTTQTESDVELPQSRIESHQLPTSIPRQATDVNPQPPPAPTASRERTIEQQIQVLKELSDLRDRGIITEEEFERKKGEVMDSD